MHDVKSVVDGLHRIHDYLDVQKHTFYDACPNEKTDCFDEAMSAIDSAIDMLKAQEPVEPLKINHDTKWQRDTECLCGECGDSFYRLKVNFCPWCGKAVKWE